jgi:hypothetical protein
MDCVLKDQIEYRLVSNKTRVYLIFLLKCCLIFRSYKMCSFVKEDTSTM